MEEKLQHVGPSIRSMFGFDVTSCTRASIVGIGALAVSMPSLHPELPRASIVGIGALAVSMPSLQPELPKKKHLARCAQCAHLSIPSYAQPETKAFVGS